MGQYFIKDGVTYFLYQETPNQKMTVKVKEDSLTLIQSGENSWSHIFRKGQTSHSSYSTPYGTFILEVTTKKLQWTSTEEGWEIVLVYHLFAGDEQTTEIELNLLVKKR